MRCHCWQHAHTLTHTLTRIHTNCMRVHKYIFQEPFQADALRLVLNYVDMTQFYIISTHVPTINTYLTLFSSLFIV